MFRFFSANEFEPKTLVKIHKPIGHCIAKRLVQLLENAGCKDNDASDKIVEICEICGVCAQYGRASAKPVLTLPL